MKQTALVPLLFFYVLLGLSIYSMWLLFAPFFTALALATVLVVVAYPLHEYIRRYLTRGRETFAALVSTLVVFSVIVTPLYFVSSVLISEFVNFYQSLETNNEASLPLLEQLDVVVSSIAPGVTIDFTEPIKQGANWVGRSAGTIFSGAVSALLTFLIALMSTFYLFRDGPRLLTWLIHISPLPEAEDTLILERIARAIRATIIGTVAVSIIQGLVATTALAFFGFERAVLWGSLGALAALIPGVGLLGVMIPSLIYLFIIGNTSAVIGLAIVTGVAIIIVDNIIAPYLISRGNPLHPLVVLLGVLGGLSLFGPIGFIIGPVMVTIFLTLLELYRMYISPQNNAQKISK